MTIIITKSVHFHKPAPLSNQVLLIGKKTNHPIRQHKHRLIHRYSGHLFGIRRDFLAVFLFTPWKINGPNLQPSPMKRKEHNLNQTSMRTCSSC